MDDAKKIPLIARLYINGGMVAEDSVTLESQEDIGRVLPEVARKHIALLTDNCNFMIELEFLNLPECERFLRFGSDPSGMVMPFPLGLYPGGPGRA